MLGILRIGTGCILWKMDAERQWFIREMRLAWVVGGLLFGGGLMNWLWDHEQPSHPPALSQQNGFCFYSEGGTHFGPVIGDIKQIDEEVQARSVTLRESQEAGLRFKDGYQASPGLGRTVAHTLCHRVSMYGQIDCVINILDVSVMAFGASIPMAFGRDHNLVILFEEATFRCRGFTARFAHHSAERIREMLKPMEGCPVSLFTAWAAKDRFGSHAADCLLRGLRSNQADEQSRRTIDALERVAASGPRLASKAHDLPTLCRLATRRVPAS